MEIITFLFICLAISYLLGEIFESVKFPRVLAPLLVGFFLTFPPINALVFKNSFETQFLASFAKLGLIFLMFYTGLEIDVGAMLKEGKNTFLIMFFGALFPFAAGFVTLHFFFDQSILISIIVAALLGVSAEAVAVEILSELGMLNTRLGRLIVGAGTLDDTLEILILGAVVTLVSGSTTGQFSLVILHLIIFFALIYLSRYLFIPIILKIIGKTTSSYKLLIASIIMVLFMSIAAEFLDVGVVLGALLAGVAIKYTLIEEKEDSERQEITSSIRTLTFGFFAPFFFIQVGTQVQPDIITNTPVLGILLTVIVLVFQPLGAGIGNLISKHSFFEGVATGFGLANKGGMELVASSLALQAGLISPDLFSSIVFMTFVATFISPVFFKFLAKRVEKKFKEEPLI
ncbi:cation:proton antiporter [Candidatus Woesearchaeota archaeon]|nr:MAG: cation:proton antiporter [Candidatus Woesearchaeota archaeon]